MRRLLTLILCSIVLHTARGQSGAVCGRSAKVGPSSCTSACVPSTGCPRPNHDCLCDGDCGHSCVPRGLSCGEPSAISNARVKYSATGFNATAVYSCNPGFTVIGAVTKRCTARGKWGGALPSCMQACQILRNLPYGAFIKNPKPRSAVYRTGERLILGCKKGFKQRGNPMRLCIGGRWTNFPFTCIGTHSCRRTIRAAFSRCTKECYPSGRSDCPRNSRCLCDGRCGYSCVENGLSCGIPPSPNNGARFFNGTGYNDTIRYQCNENYTLTGNPVRRCTAKKTWEGMATSCLKDCAKPSRIPSNAYIENEKERYASGERVTFKCKSGYKQDGLATTPCFLGSWTISPFQCKRSGCGDPGVPKNGKKIGILYNVNREVYFTCRHGFLLKGSSVRTCGKDFQWTGTQPHCQGVECGPMQPLAHGVVMGVGTTYRTVLRFRCDIGYELTGDASSICQANGRWSVTPQCNPVDCGLLDAPAHGTMKGSSSTFTSQLVFSCDAGYIMSGSATRTCLVNASWNGTQPTCTAVNCGPLKSPVNGRSTTKSTTYSSVARVTCDKGFNLIGSESRVCQANGTWSGKEVTCVESVSCIRTTAMAFVKCTRECRNEKDCPARSKCLCDGQCGFSCVETGMQCPEPPVPPNGVRFFSGRGYNATVRYKCNENYTLTGNPVRRCTAKKTWEGMATSCLPDCLGQPLIPAHAYIVNPKARYKSGDRVSLKCRSGYVQQNEPKSTPSALCILGKWDNTVMPKCERVDCGPFHVPLYGSVDSWSTVFGSTITFRCDHGFRRSGSDVRRCRADGTWSGVKTLCLATSCKKPHIPTNAQLTKLEKDRYELGDQVLYKCRPGYVLKGSPKRTCRQGLWTAVSFVCTDKSRVTEKDRSLPHSYRKRRSVSCRDPGTPRHAIRLGSAFTYGSSLTFRCLPGGYVPRGFRNIHCQRTGMWSATPLHCLYCKTPLLMRNTSLTSLELSASSERDSRHSANHGRLYSDSAWCSARSEFAKYFQVDFGRHVEITAVATQGHPNEYKWLHKYQLRYTMGYYWFTYRQDYEIKVFQGNRDRSTVVKHELKPSVIANKVRIYRHEDTREFSGSTACLRVEFYGCPFYSSCITRGASVITRWYKDSKQVIYVRGFVTSLTKHHIKIIPSDEQRSLPHDKPLTLSTKGAPYIIPDVVPHKRHLDRGIRVIAVTHAQGVPVYATGRIYYVIADSRIRVQFDDGGSAWRDIRGIRKIIHPQYCTTPQEEA